MQLPFEGLGGGRWVLRDLLGEARHERDGNELLSRDLYLDVGPWKGHLFEVIAR